MDVIRGRTPQLIGRAIRAVNALRRPSKARNLRRLHRRGETPGSFAIREATIHDVAAVARLHVTTWRATHGLLQMGPTYETRVAQWNAKFASDDPEWFCFILETHSGVPVGFANGHRYLHAEPRGFSGQLEKIYLLPEYQRIGFGRRLMCQVARRLLADGITSMLLFSQPENPSCRFFEALGGEKLLSDSGEFHGAYGWREIHGLASDCSD